MLRIGRCTKLKRAAYTRPIRISTVAERYATFLRTKGQAEELSAYCLKLTAKIRQTARMKGMPVQRMILTRRGRRAFLMKFSST